MSAPADLTFRDQPRAADLARVRAIVEATGFFSDEEVRIAVELLDDRLARGPASDYRFLFGELDGTVVGYTCYGRVALTRASWDLYWIATDPTAQGRGVGKALLAESERRIALAGTSERDEIAGPQVSQRVYAETSSRPQYEPTRRFYERTGYTQAALLEDFYAPGDGKVIFVKTVG